MRTTAVGLVGAMLGLLGAQGTAAACSVCGCGDPLLSASAAVPVARQLRLELNAEYLTASARSDEDPAVVERLAQTTLALVAAYSPVERLNLLLVVPAVYKQWRASGGEEKPESANPVGLGDVELGARYFFVDAVDVRRLMRNSLALAFGLSLPTGPDDASADGARIDQHAQLGTGAFGPYLGTQYRLARDPFNLFASVSGRMRSTNSFGYRYGDALVFTVLFQLRPLDRLALSVALDGRLAGRDRIGGDWQLNTGGLVLAATPGVQVILWRELWLSAQVQVPFFKDLYGQQSVGPVFGAGLQYRLF